MRKKFVVYLIHNPPDFVPPGPHSKATRYIGLTFVESFYNAGRAETHIEDLLKANPNSGSSYTILTTYEKG